MPTGLRGTEVHRDQGQDQGADHETKENFGLVVLARELLVAVAAGEERSVEIAASLARGVLGDPMVKRAIVVEEMVRTRSPFALMRAVELAEVILQVTVRARPADRSG